MNKVHNLVGRPLGASADAQSCLRRGQAFAKAAKLYLDNSSIGDDRAPFAVCSIQAFELMLKSFLRAQGEAFEMLRKRPYGHDLTSLCGACEGRGLQLDAETKWVISEVSNYSVAKTFEYVDQPYFAYPVLPNQVCSAMSFPEAIVNAMNALMVTIENVIQIDPVQDQRFPNQSV